MAKVSQSRRKWVRRRKRTQSQLARSERPLLTCYRSSKHIYAQLVEAESGRTLLSVSSLSPAVRGAESGSEEEGGRKRAVARAVGKEIAKLALARDIKSVAFNRNGFVYHGRVQALADGAREGGLSL